MGEASSERPHEQTIEALRRRIVDLEARYRTAAELVSDFVYESEAVGGGGERLRWVSESFAEVTGATSAELAAGEGWLALVHPGDRQRYMEERARLHAGAPFELEYRIVTPGHELRWLQDIARRVPGCGPLRVVGVVRDVTARHQRGEALASSERLLRGFVMHALEGIVLTDTQGQIVEWNPAQAELTGLSSEAAIGQPLWDVQYNLMREGAREPGLYERIKASLQQITATGDVGRWSRPHQRVIRRLDGSVRTVEAIAFALDDESGFRICTTMRDVTDRARAEEALAHSEQRYRDLVQSIPAVVWEADGRTNRFTFVSEQAVPLLGYPLGAWLASPSFWVDHLHPVDREQALRCRRLLSAQPQQHACEYRMIAADQRTVWLRDIATGAAQPGGALLLRGVLFDISALKRAEEALRESEQRARAIADLTSDYVYGTRLSADGRTESMWVTTGFTSITGYTTDELIATGGWLTIVHPADLPRLYASLGVLRDGQIGSCEYRVVTKSGALRWVRDFARPEEIDDQGHVRYIVGAVQDITAQRRLEEDRLALERKMLEVQHLESLGVLAGGIAHDFNNLLGIILGNAGLALDDLPADSPACWSLHQIEHACRRAADLTRQMLVYAGRQSLASTQLHLGQLLSSIAPTLRAAVPHSVQLQIVSAPTLPPIEGDAGQLQQVIVNLLSNAVEAIGEHPGTIQITVEARTVYEATLAAAALGSELPPGRYVALEVSDSGAGMDGATREQIFDPFFSTKFAGRGLGLAVVQGVVRAHHGAILVRTAPGQGTTVTILLPPLEP